VAETGEADGVRRSPAVHEVVLADQRGRTAIADSLSDAFFDDPVMSWMLPDDASRRRRLGFLFDVLLKAHYLELGTVWTTPDTAGAAMWASPGNARIPTTTILRNSRAMFRALGTRSLRALRALSRVEQLHPKEPHWYLGVLGTRTSQQGRGIGSALLGPVLAECDSEGLPAYLESSKYSNIAFYRRHGFEVTGEIKLVDGGPTVWPMWRDPKGT
jgi:ribosomal protein S18 acetylase RimI-like enzyme